MNNSKRSMKTVEKFNQLVLDSINEGAFPGANFAIVFKDGAYLGSLGNKSLYPIVEKNHIDTLYDMASLTKIVCTTTCALRLIEEGKLRLYASVKKYFPAFPFENITIWNLMTHTSGLPEGIRGITELKTPEEVWNRILKVELKYEPGTKINYSDIGYIVLGKVIENITNKPLNVFAKEEIFDKLKMNDTCFLPSDIDRCAPTEKRDDNCYQGIVRGFVHDETSFCLKGVAGHAGLFSTVKDMVNFLTMILNDGKFEQTQFLSKNTIDILYTPQVEEKEGVALCTTRRSLGWINRGAGSSAGELTSLDTILHTGFTGTNIWVDRKNEVAFVLLSNRVHPTRKNVLHMDARARFANFIIAHLDELKKEIMEGIKIK